MNIQFSNLAKTTLAATLGVGATSLSVATGGGALFPSLTTGKYFYATIIDAATLSIKEIIKCTARSGDTFSTIIRAQGGTSAHPYVAGDIVALGWTAEGITESLDQRVGFVNVKDKGAKGDGTTDDTAAIEYAMTLSTCLFFPAGTYMVDTLDLNDSGLTWYGEGPESTIISRSGALSGNTILSVIADNVCLRDMKIDGNKGSVSSACTCVTLEAVATRFNAQNVHFVNGKSNSGYGAGVTSVAGSAISRSSTFTNCQFVDNDSYGAYLVNAGGVSFLGCRFYGNGGGIIADNYDVGFAQKIKRIVVSGCSIVNNSGNGIALDNYLVDNIAANLNYGPTTPEVSFVSITGNEVANNSGYGISVAGWYATIGNNVVHENTVGGILCPASYSTVSDNIVYNSGSWGIDMGGSYYSTVSGNNITDCAGTGLNIEGAVKLSATGNYLKNNGGTTGSQIKVENVAADANSWAFAQTTSGVSISDNTIVLTSSQIGIYVADAPDFVSIANNHFQPASTALADVKRCIYLIATNANVRNNDFFSSVNAAVAIDGSNQLSIPDCLDSVRISNSGTVGTLQYTTALEIVGRQGVGWCSLTAGGSGYTSAPSVGFSGGGGSGAAATAFISKDGVVRGIRMTNYGSGYTGTPTVALTGGGGAGATATAQVGVPLNIRRNLDILCNGGGGVTFTRLGTPNIENSAAADTVIASNGMISLFSTSAKWYVKSSS